MPYILRVFMSKNCCERTPLSRSVCESFFSRCWRKGISNSSLKKGNSIFFIKFITPGSIKKWFGTLTGGVFLHNVLLILGDYHLSSSASVWSSKVTKASTLLLDNETVTGSYRTEKHIITFLVFEKLFSLDTVSYHVMVQSGNFLYALYPLHKNKALFLLFRGACIEILDISIAVMFWLASRVYIHT